MFGTLKPKYEDDKNNREETFAFIPPALKEQLLRAEAHNKPVDKRVRVDRVTNEAIKTVSKSGGIVWF